MKPEPRLCDRCGHPADEHGQERQLIGDYETGGSKRELCLLCDGYEEPGYPNGKAWHRLYISPVKV